ncbi:hypothetical protein [Thermoplasma volcanium]|nr:hypothetical protein [Thermoplasma volcanium]
MKATIIKKGDIRKLLKETRTENKADGKASVAAKILSDFGQEVVFIKSYDGEDIDLKVKNVKDEYRYIKVIRSNKGFFKIASFDIAHRIVGNRTLFDIIMESEKFNSSIRGEILNMVNFQMKRRAAIWVLFDSEKGTLYPLNTKSVIDIILHDLEYRYERGMIDKHVDIEVPTTFIENFWARYLKSKNKTPHEVWRSMIV